ncbi:SEC-C motif-containing protein [Cohnella sp. OV330]|uniref:YecA family protein n=1 Tax=Cohnella sp. OV330 TaxID=1855288 RepID=UPI0008EE7A90|nr:SEC-C metal-binding domain-containing protein [Cohnella sp. OV330]SFA71914.1 SEC-C motif-containing protein [Cohnella sp. OV330]
MADHMKLDGEWPALAWPLALKDALMPQTRESLQRMARLLKIYDWENEKDKDALVGGLVPVLADSAAESTELWDEERWALIRRLVKSNGLMADPPESGPVAYYLAERGIAFPGEVKGKKSLVMPTELVERFAKLEGLSGTPAQVKRNTDHIKLTQGMLYYYGVLEETELESRLIALAGETPEDGPDMFEVLVDALDFRAMYDVDEDGLYANLDVEEPQELLRIQQARGDLPYREFTKTELLKAGEPEYVERTKAHQELAGYLAREYAVDKQEADMIAEICADTFKNGKSMSAAFEILQFEFSIEDAQTVEEVGALLARLNNGTRQWVLKGHRPDELNMSVGGGVPSNVLAMPQRSHHADVISIQTGRKIGRNDPCPCGSGKKFKKCCGAVGD